MMLQILERSSSSFPSPPPPPPPAAAATMTQEQSFPSSGGTSAFNLDSKITPSILLIIVILAIIFFVSGLLHLLVRFLLRPNTRSPDESDTVTALQGQLQQLFHLHDAGVDQSFIDTLPVFHYKAIIGVKDPFDCAVCLCEFEPEDKLRLLPKCSHAFHMECIDTWLLSHSTCPLCRASLLPPQNPSCTPIVCVLESGSSDTSREMMIGERDGAPVVGRSNSVLGSSNSFLGGGAEFCGGSDRIDFPRKSVRKEEEEEEEAVNDKIVTVKLGKFKNVDGSGGEGSSTEETNATTGNKMSSNSRRCYSMGSFAYVMDDKCSLQVPIRAAAAKKWSAKKPGFLPLKPGHRSAISEYRSDSRREFNGVEAFKSIEIHERTGGVMVSSASHDPRSKSERFSISKIWRRGDKKEGNNKGGGGGGEPSSSLSLSLSSSKRVFAVRQSNGSLLGDVSRRTISEIEIDDGGSWLDDETRSCYSIDDSQAMGSSSATRRTLLWLMGRHQNKVVQQAQVHPPPNV